MPDIARFPLADGSSVLVEVDPAPAISPAGRAGDAVENARITLENALSGVVDAADAALGRFKDMARSPDEVELKFGVKLDVEAGAFIAKTGVGAQFEVKLKWRKDGLPLEEETVEG